MSRNTKANILGKFGSTNLLQQIMRENYYSSNDGDPLVSSPASADTVDRWDETNWLDSLLRIRTLSSQAENHVRDLKAILGKQPRGRNS